MPEERVATPLEQVDVKPLLDSVKKIEVQEELERLQGIKRTLDKYVAENKRALQSKAMDITVADGMDEDDLPDSENLLEWMDEYLSEGDLKKKYAILSTQLKEVTTEIANLEKQKKALRLEEKTNIMTLREAEKAEFARVLDALPKEMHLLKVLNDLGEYEDLTALIDQYDVLAKDSPDAYAQYLSEMTQRVDNATRAVALRALLRGETGSTAVSARARNALIQEPAAPFKKLEEDPGLIASATSYVSSFFFGKSTVEEAVDAGEVLKKEIKFSDLAPEVQQEIIAQRAFILKLQAYLSYTKLDKNDPLYVDLDNYYRQLQSNVNNALLNEKDVSRAREDFERIKAEIAMREEEIATKVFGSNFYTSTNAQAAGVVAGGLTGIMFLGTIGGPAAAALALAAMGGFYKDASNKVKPVVEDNIAAEQELLSDKVEEKVADIELEDSKMRPVEYDYIQKMDNLFEVKTGVDNIPIVEQTVMGQLKGAGGAAYSAAQEGVQQARSALQNKVLEFLESKYPRLGKLFKTFLENWKDMNIRRTIMLSVGMVGAIFITAMIPPLWPLCIGLMLACAATVVAWRLGVPVTKLANKLFDAAGSVVASVSNVINFTLKPIRNLDFSGNKYGPVELAARLTIGGLCAVAGGFLIATFAPAAGLMIGLGAISGMYLGLSASEVFKNVFVKPVQINRQASNIAQKLESHETKDLSLREEQSKVLNAMYKNFDKLVLDHFKARHEELVARVEIAQRQVPRDPEVIARIAQDLDQMENNWVAFKEAINEAPQKVCDVLKDCLRSEYLSQRETLVKEPTQYKERARKQMNFSGMEKNTPVGNAPEFKMEFAQDFEGERAKMKDLEQMMAVVQTIESNYKSKSLGM